MSGERPVLSLAEEQSVMQQLLAEHGCCSPLDVLLETNRLAYEDYLAWRCGKRHTLDDALLGGAPDTRDLLHRMGKWARSINLEERNAPLYGINDSAGTELVASRNAALDALLRTEFQSAARREQLDIFQDTSETAAMNDMAAALASRDAEAAQARLDHLIAINPDHWAIADTTLLVKALQLPAPASLDQAFARLAVLEQRWLPAACAVLRNAGRDFLAPVWRTLAQALSGAPFDPAQPRRHAGWAYLNGLDWANAKRSIQAIDKHRSQPLPLGWLAAAQWRLHDRKAAIACWFELCWRHPEHFEELVESNGFPDSSIRRAWFDAQDEDIDPAITPAWFPAWLALADPRLAKMLAPGGGNTEPERAFDLLLALGVGGSDRQNMDNRKALQALHPGLLKRYLDSLENG